MVKQKHRPLLARHPKIKKHRRRSLAPIQKGKPKPASRKSPPLRPQQYPFWDLVPVRLVLVWLALCGGGLGLMLNLFRIQILEGQTLSDRAQAQHRVDLLPYLPRRPIIDRQGKLLATDQLVYSLYVHPKLFKVSPQEVADQLAPVLNNTTPQTLVSRFAQQESGIQLSNNLSEAIADQITALRLDGLELIRRYSRFYPQGETLAEVLGYVNWEHVGQAGIEYSQQGKLEREIQNLKLSRAGNGMIIPTQLPPGMLDFDELQLQLTVDLPLQRAAHEALAQGMAAHNAQRGAVIVMDVHSGEIRALACAPSYDPQRYYEADMALFKNWTITDLYEPGSTFKPINVAIALEAGVANPTDIFYDSGALVVDTWPIYNHDYRTRGGHGNLSIAQILQVSSNIGMIKLMEKLSPKEFYGKLLALGLNETMGLDLPGEVPNRLKDQQTFTQGRIESATAAFGQGFSLTPMKLVQLHGAIANGGELVTPHLVSGMVDGDGEYQWQAEYARRRVFSPEVSQTVLTMMETVVTEGSGKVSQIPGYRIAGKTGTAQKAKPSGGYYDHKRITSFVASFPVDQPRYVVLAVIDEPQGGFGSTVAAPIVKSVLESIIALEQIPRSP